MWEKLAKTTDKFEAASIIQPAADMETQRPTIPPTRTTKRKTTNALNGTFWDRPSAPKRKPNPDDEAMMASSAPPVHHNLIVDTGASHVLFQERHTDLLEHVQMSRPNRGPFAILRAANGQVLTAIGKGIFRVKHISVVAFIFRNEDLVHNLLGIAPFADCGCTAIFTARKFTLSHHNTVLLSGERHSANLWHISLHSSSPPTISPPSALSANDASCTLIERFKTFSNQMLRDLPPTTTKPNGLLSSQPVLLLHEDTRQDARYVQFVHACFGSPPPSTFLHAVRKGYLSGENQFPRLTARMVCKHMPNSEATARGHLNKTRIAQPHAASQSVSARRRYDTKMQSKSITFKKENSSSMPRKPFDPTTVPKSTTLHLDYTGRLPQRCSDGTLYFLVACWGSYIHLEPLHTMQGAETAKAMKSAVLFFRQHNVTLDTTRMDNQSSPEVRAIADELGLKWELVNPYQKEANRAERAIRTGKNHLIAVRAGFHPDFPSTHIDRCLFQVELTLNLLHPFEYDPAISAHYGLLGSRFDFARHPIAPIGAKVFTWDSPDNRGSWADHGIPGIYLGPAMTHFRGFHIWVPQNCAARISGTVWWFFKAFVPDDDLLAPENDHILYPLNKDRPSPQLNGADLLGRCFLEPNAGVCCITHLGPVINNTDQDFSPTLHYRCLQSQAEFFTTVEQIVLWINTGPLLPRP